MKATSVVCAQGRFRPGHSKLVSQDPRVLTEKMCQMHKTMLELGGVPQPGRSFAAALRRSLVN
jgi:hypothetical protein